MFLERWGIQCVTLLVSIVLARILDPGAYGTVALVTTLNSLLAVFIDSGMGNALIQKKNADDLDYSTLFYFNIGMCLVLYLAMFFAAPFIANFYDMPELVVITRVSSLSLVFSAFANVQQSYALKNFKYKIFFYSTLGGTIGSAIAGITCALLGLGVWALIIQSHVNIIVRIITLWFTVKWRPKLMFSFKRLKGLFSYGWKILVSTFVNQIYTELRQLIIAKLYTTEDLAYYNKAHGWPHLLMTNVVGVVDRVLFPIMAKEQDNKEKVKSLLKRSIQTSTYVMTPLLVGLVACADSFVSVILTDKWLPSVPYTQIFCLGYILYALSNANLNSYKATGRSDVFLIVEVISKIIGIVTLLISIWFGVGAMVISYSVFLIISSIVNSFPNRKLLNYGFFKQLLDITPTLLLSAVMGVLVYSIKFFGLNNLLTLVIQVAVGIIIYVLGSIIFRFESFFYLWDFIKSKLTKKKRNT